MNRIQIWTLATRPKTLVASISPVLIGSILGIGEGFFNFRLFLFTLATALGIQITTNLANDYFDFLKGADTQERKGFMRVTQAGLVEPSAMKRATLFAVFSTALCGAYLICIGGIPIAGLLLLSLVLAIAYTGGPFPLAYLGLGEVFVLLFFGPVAVLGTYYLQTGSLSWDAGLAGLSPGAISTAILIVNNIRDIEEDRRAEKKTLIVRFGKLFGKWEFIALLAMAFFPPFYFCSEHPFSLLALLALIPAFPLAYAIFNYSESRELNPLFAKTGQLLWLYTLLFCIGWML